MLTRLILAAAMAVAGAGSADAANIHGAIAFSQSTGLDGYSYNYPSRGGAEQRALKYCLPRAADCRIVIHFYNACAALAVGDGRGWGVAWAAKRDGAEGQALYNCSTHTTNCYVQRWVCSGSY